MYVCTVTFYDSATSTKYQAGNVYDISPEAMENLKRIGCEKRFESLARPGQMEPTLFEEPKTRKPRAK
jgi:hypothetical protein